MRAVFDQAPIGEREAAMALGGTRFGVARTVVLPFGKGGIIGGTMLALGRALGETAAVLIIISPEYVIKPSILEAGTQTVSALIAGNFGNATKSQLTALLAAGFVLFVITLGVNSAAAVFIRRSRSGLARRSDLSASTPRRWRRSTRRRSRRPDLRATRRGQGGAPEVQRAARRQASAPPGSGSHDRRLAVTRRIGTVLLRPRRLGYVHSWT